MMGMIARLEKDKKQLQAELNKTNSNMLNAMAGTENKGATQSLKALQMTV